MLTQEQIKEIKEHLEKAQNPVFYFDNDQDGLCSFLLLQRYCGKGKGVPIKTFPSLDEGYFRKVNELNADYIFILDKPVVSEEFFKRAEEINIPIVWIDHHPLNENCKKRKIPSFVNYYNPFLKSEKNLPTTYLCYNVTKRKEDLWIAVIGCISDKFVPEFYEEFIEKYPDLAIKSDNAFEIFYSSEIGRIARILGFGLKDRTTNVINMLRFLIKVRSPYEILEENSKTYTIHKRVNEINRRYQKLIKRALEESKKSEKLLFFKYSGNLSISSDLANELSYRLPDKVIVVVYISGIKANISVRGKKIKNIVLKSLEGIEGATGGGHEDAVGAQMEIKYLEKFKSNLLENLRNR